MVSSSQQGETPEAARNAANTPTNNINKSLHLYFLSLVQQIAKIDIVTRKHIEWRQDSCYPSEPVFVASPGAVEEDDGEAAGTLVSGLQVYETVRTGSDSWYSLPAGVILSSVISPDPNISPFMLVLDAKNFKEIARASIPASVHMDLHGLFIPAAV